MKIYIHPIIHNADEETSNRIEVLLAKAAGHDENVFKDGREMSWYTREQDVRRISKAFPNVTIELNCETTNLVEHIAWKEYYRDGNHEEAKGVLTFPEFDVYTFKFVKPTPGLLDFVDNEA